MGVLVVGDVHGCYHTLKALVRTHWNPEKDRLILIGDLINKGLHSAKALKFALKLQKQHPKDVTLIRGNHEQWFLEHYNSKSQAKNYRSLIADFEGIGLTAKEVARQLKNWPLHWQNETLFISHAGLSDAAKDPFDPSDINGLLKNRKPLKSLSKVQVIGHNIITEGKPRFRPQENAWYLDTGAWFQMYLSALLFAEGEAVPKVIQVKRKAKDDSQMIVK